MTRILCITMLLTASACDSKLQPQAHRTTRGNEHVSAANLFTDLYAHSRLSEWNVRASAAGNDCRVLFIEVPLVLDDTMVEGLQYGGGKYAVYDGGADRFSRDRGFRTVRYRDASGRQWTYGEQLPQDTEGLAPCR